MCLACRRASGPLCHECRLTLRPVPPTVVGGVPAASAFDHSGAAISLVHRLKYDGIELVARLLAITMAPLVPSAARCLTPIPRAAVRQWRHGIDSAGALAVGLGALLELPVVAALERPVWHPRQAGKARHLRQPGDFRAIRDLPPGAVMVDDVFTTGATLRAGIDAVGLPIASVTATRAAGTSLFMRASD